MAVQLSVAARNALLDAIETATGATAIMRIRTGAAPANCAAADTGTVVATITLPADWMAAASAGTKSLLGTWQDTAADATGTAAHFRIYDSAGTTCHIQGTVGTSASDLIVDSVSFTAGQQFTVTAFTLTAPNA
ncbi:MAG: hypothetical protein RIR91_336 [Verrucomicrobiota bacterium]|jgi:hypothetical protein